MCVKSQFLRGDLICRHHSVLQFRHLCRSGNTDLIQAVQTAHNHRTLGTKLFQHLGYRLRLVPVVDPHQLTVCPCRVGQGSQHIEYGAEPPHRFREPGDFFDGFPLDPECRQQRANLHR
ncbi:hypothetical protein D3C75_1034840 [compost metagenome]